MQVPVLQRDLLPALTRSISSSSFSSLNSFMIFCLSDRGGNLVLEQFPFAATWTYNPMSQLCAVHEGRLSFQLPSDLSARNLKTLWHLHPGSQ